jgi:hypothetical protein
LTGDCLTVGDAVVALGPSTEICHVEAAPLQHPSPDEPDWAAQRFYVHVWSGGSAGGYLPGRAGGPVIEIKTDGQAVSLQPLLYGSGRYIHAARPEAAAFMQRLVSYGEEGNARAWLGEGFPSVHDPGPPFDFERFSLVYAVTLLPLMFVSTLTLVRSLTRLLEAWGLL